MKKLSMIPLLKMFSLLLLLSAAGCYVDVIQEPPPCYQGRNGFDGRAFLGLNYSSVQPGYIWGNNPAVPGRFNYGTYYISAPGHYQLYYEGAYMYCGSYTEYYWDVTYDLWIHPGTAGGPCYDGANGADSYLMLWLDPNGPGVDRVNKKGESMNLIRSTADVIEYEIMSGEGGMHVIYRRLPASRRTELGPGLEHTMK